MTVQRGILLAVTMMLAWASSSMAGGIGKRIADPVPTDLRARVDDLLRLADADAALGAARIIDDFWRQTGMLLLRVEADCLDDACMTIIARVEDDRLVPEVTLKADTLVEFLSTGCALWGMPAYQIIIKGRGSTGIRVWFRNGDRIVEACDSCFPSDEERGRRVALPPSPPLPSPTFEEFTRWLGRDP